MPGFYHSDDKYLGDSVYVSQENNSIILYTYNGVGKPSHTIVLEKEVYDALTQYIATHAGIGELRGWPTQSK